MTRTEKALNIVALMESLEPKKTLVISPNRRLQDMTGTLPSGTAVTSLSKSGEAQLKNNVTLSEGANVTLTQVGQNIEVASAGGGGGADEKLKISGNDTTTNYGENKIVAGTGISIAVLNEGGNEQLEISKDPPADIRVKDAVGAATDVGFAVGNESVPVRTKVGEHADVDIVSSVLPTGAATESTLTSVKTAVEILDNVVSGNEMQVDVLSVIDTSSSLDHGSNLDIDTSAEQITATSFTCKRGVLLKADSTNTGIIYVGNSDVTDGDTAATDGIPLSAGQAVTIEIDNPNKLYAIASTNNQKIYWLAV